MSLSQELYSDQYKYELKINEYEAEQKWLNDLLMNTTLSGEEKIVLYTIRRIIRRVRYDMSEPVHIWMNEICTKSGLAYRTVKKVVTRLHELGLIIKETRGKGKSQQTWFSIPGDVIVSSKNLADGRNRNRGGARRKCEKCGSENIDIYVAYECRNCGHIHQADITHQFEEH